MKADEFFTWNYYTYNVINLTQKQPIYETDNLEDARTKLLECKISIKGCKFAIQQEHIIARLIK